MSKQFSHLIVTRFNLPLWNAGKTPDPDWLTHRFELFKRYCYPSITGQTEQNFKWITLLSGDTPAEFRTQIAQLKRTTPVYLDKFYSKETIKTLVNEISPDSTHLITTTLDNDDALAADFVATIQAQFTGQKFSIINFTNGLRYKISTQKLYHCAIPSSPFVSLIENIAENKPHTILRCLPHSTIRNRYGPINEIDTPPMWLQIVHERNAAATGIRGRLRANGSHLGRFNIENMPLTKHSAPLLENAWRSLERSLINMTPQSLKSYLRQNIWDRKHK